MASSAHRQTSAETLASHWEQHREMFRELYLIRGMSLEQVKKTAEDVHGLPKAPLSTYETKLRDELRLQKNMKAEHWAAIGRLLATRPPRSRVFYHDIIIPRNKLKRKIRRNSKIKIEGQYMW